MRSLLHPTTREQHLAALGGDGCVFDCLECQDGVYVGAETPHCSACGVPAPDAIRELIRAYERTGGFDAA